MQFDQFKRRDFITVLGGAAAVWPLGARAQPGPDAGIGFTNSALSQTLEQRVGRVSPPADHLPSPGGVQEAKQGGKANVAENHDSAHYRCTAWPRDNSAHIRTGVGRTTYFYGCTVEMKGGVTVDKEPFPTDALPAGPGYVLNKPDQTGRWEVSVYMWTPSQIIVNQDDDVTLEFVGINGANHRRRSWVTTSHSCSSVGK